MWLSLWDFSAPVPNGVKKIQILPVEVQHHKLDRQKEGEKIKASSAFVFLPAVTRAPFPIAKCLLRC